MRKYFISVIIIVALSFMACGDYLDQVPEKDVETFESIFERRASADIWLTQATEFMAGVSFSGFGSNAGVVGADEFVTGNYIRDNNTAKLFNIADGLQMSQDPLGNIWTTTYYSIRMLNTFISNIDNVYDLTAAEKRNWKAEAIAVKAFYYFELVRRYGPIVLVPKNIDVNADLAEMQIPRSHVDTCFNEIVRLLDEAIPDLLYGKERLISHKLFLSKEGAMALKARVLLYQASPLFNGNAFYSDFKNKNGELLFNSTYDRNKWLLAAEAADKAAEMCEDGGRALVSGATGKKTDLLNKMADIENMSFSRFNNSEYLLEWKYPSTFYQFILPRLVGDDDNFDSQALGCLSPSMKMVEMYYTANGLPIDADITWNYSNRYKLASESSPVYEGVVPMNIDVVNLHLRREPRFYACIAGDRMYWQRGTNTADKDYNFLVKAHKGEEPWGTQYDFIVSNSWQNINGYWLKKHLFSWFNTLGYANNLQGNETAAIIRLAEVYLMQAEAWNEYLEQPDSRVYDPLDKVRERAGVLPVREAWGSYSNNPVKVTTKVGMRDIIHQEYGIEFAFEGHRYWDIRRWLTAHQTMNEKQYGWNVIGTTDQAFYNYETGPVVVYSSNKFIAPRDYLDPFDAEEILISGMVQNPGWGGR